MPVVDGNIAGDEDELEEQGEQEAEEKDGDDMLHRGDNNNLLHAHKAAQKAHRHVPTNTYTHVHSCQVRENAARHKCNNNSKKNNNTGADEHKNRTIIKMNNDRLIANK